MPPTPVTLPPEVAAALARGQPVLAIRLLREATGMGLKDATDAVQSHAMRQPSGTAAASSGASGGFVFPEAAAAAVARGDLIAAIAMLREANPRLDLKAAKDAVGHFRRDTRPSNAAQSKVQVHYPARVPTVMAGDRGSHGWILGVVAVAIAALVWWFVGGA
jgi:ribosomal protein L7/L12